jgi:hypothetical protein
MALLLILASPHVLLELSGAGARPVHPIHVIHGDETNLVAVRAITDITGPAGGFASVASDPKPT